MVTARKFETSDDQSRAKYGINDAVRVWDNGAAVEARVWRVGVGSWVRGKTWRMYYAKLPSGKVVSFAAVDHKAVLS